MKLWLVSVRDKALPGHPDVAIAVIEGNAGAADAQMREMVKAYAAAGGQGAVGRFREVERSKTYPVGQLVCGLAP